MFQNPKSPKNIRNITNRVTNPDKADQIGTACHVTNSAVEGGCYASRIKKGGEAITPQASLNQSALQTGIHQQRASLPDETINREHVH